MNQATRDIAVLLDIPLDEAERVQDRIDEEWLLDWSECTERELRFAAREAYAMLRQT